MSSGVSREDFKDQLWLAGIKNPAVLNRLMRIFDACIYHAARDMAADMAARMQPEITTETRKRTYRCTGDCRQFKTLEEFPEKKRLNPRLPSPCSYCEDRMVTVYDAGRSGCRSS